MRLLLNLLLFTLVVFVPAYAYIIGVAPANENICIAPGDTALVNLTISDNATTEIILDIAANVSWAQTWTQLTMPPSSAKNLPVLFNASGLPEGNYSGYVFICAPAGISNLSKSAAITIRYCISPSLALSVSKTCSPLWFVKRLFQLVMLAMAAILAGILLLRHILIKQRRKRHGHHL